MDTSIAWADSTLNVIVASGPNSWYCQQASTGCENCYASRFNVARGGQPFAPLGARFGVTTRGDSEIDVYYPDLGYFVRLRLAMSRLLSLIGRSRHRTIFVNSMTDTFWDAIPDAWIDQIICATYRAPQQRYLLLTKRARRMVDYWSNPETPRRIYDALVYNPANEGRPIHDYTGWPPPNVGLGVSVENESLLWRADLLRTIPAAVRFVSAEPLLGSLEKLRFDCPSCAGTGLHPDPGYENVHLDPDHPGEPLTCLVCRGSKRGIDWLIVGGESGGPEWRSLVSPCDDCTIFTRHGCRRARVDTPGRPCSGYWPRQPPLIAVRQLRQAAASAGIPFCFEQWGGPRPQSAGRFLDRQIHDARPSWPPVQTSADRWQQYALPSAE